MGKKVLVVDDERLIVKGIKFSLVQDDMEVDCAYDGEEALELAKKTEYDIVLLDVMLPKLSGFEVCQMIREFSNMPIIIMGEFVCFIFIWKPVFRQAQMYRLLQYTLKKTGAFEKAPMRSCISPVPGFVYRNRFSF